jgi:hypothetical protein
MIWQRLIVGDLDRGGVDDVLGALQQVCVAVADGEGELAAAHDPVRYRDLIVNPGRRRSPPASDRPRAKRPWRTATPPHSG